MKFSCEKALLLGAVSTASRAVAVKSSIPALEGILIEAGEQLRLTGYNLETGIRAAVPAEIREKGSLVLSARLFGEIIRKMPDDVVVFTSENYMVNIKCGLSEFNILGTDPEEFLGYNPFTASIEIKLHSDYANSDSIAKIEKMIKKNTNIQDVLYQRELIDLVNENIRNISLVLLALAVVLALISFALINNTIRLAIYSKRFLIHTMKLVGASWSFIRRPFLRRNIWSGILEGILSDAILMGAAYWLVSYEPELIRVITPEVMLLVSGSVLLFGVLITFMCAYLSINRYLKMKASTLYYI